MIDITFYDKITGEIKLNYSGNELQTILENRPDLDYIEGSFYSNEFYIENNEPISIPERPSGYHYFDFATKTYRLVENSLENIKNKKKSEINNTREGKIYSPISYTTYSIDADRDALQNINGKILEVKTKIANSIPVPPETLIWRTAENTTLYFETTSDYIAFLENLVIDIADRTTKLYQISWNKKEEVDLLQTVEDVLAYDVQAGWNLGN